MPRKLRAVIACGGFRPAASRKVGARSAMLTKSSTARPPLAFAFHITTSGTRVPVS